MMDKGRQSQKIDLFNLRVINFNVTLILTLLCQSPLLFCSVHHNLLPLPLKKGEKLGTLTHIIPVAQ